MIRIRIISSLKFINSSGRFVEKNIAYFNYKLYYLEQLSYVQNPEIPLRVFGK